MCDDTNFTGQDGGGGVAGYPVADTLEVCFRGCGPEQACGHFNLSLAPLYHGTKLHVILRPRHPELHSADASVFLVPRVTSALLVSDTT